MSPLLLTDADEVKRFIYKRVHSHPRFTTVIAVSVDRYGGELFATVWVGQEPDTEMREAAYELEAELRHLGVTCSIIIKTDRQLPFGGTYGLRTKQGEFSYRYHRIDPSKDEDIVYVYVVYRGVETYRFRLSLSGTLASMLRSRNRLQEPRIEEVYLDWIRGRIEGGDLAAEGIVEFMFNSQHLTRFVGPN